MACLGESKAWRPQPGASRPSGTHDRSAGAGAPVQPGRPGKLREHPGWLERLITDIQDAIRLLHPKYGESVAGDGTDIPAYANGQRYIKKGGPERTIFADPDATWGHRGSISTRTGGGYYGYKSHSLVCTDLELPVTWRTQSASSAETPQIPLLFEHADLRHFEMRVATFDKGYDAGPVYDLCHKRSMRVVIPLRDSDSSRDGYAVPECTHGERVYRWMYAGTDIKRGATKWRCPVGKCQPKSIWLPLDRFHPAIPRQLFHLPKPEANPRSKKAYKQRSSVERFWSRLKDQWGLLHGLRVRRLDRVAQHVDLTIAVFLMFGLARLRLQQ